jgi:hypothetical protein
MDPLHTHPSWLLIFGMGKLGGFSHVVMEMDSLEFVNLWSSRQDDRSIVAPILDEVGELVSDFMSFFYSAF